MWLFTVYGFFSVSSFTDATHVFDQEMVSIRGRDKSHLLNLQTRFPVELQPYQILEDVGTDYAFRMVMPHCLWISLLVEMSTEQTWSNFKNEVYRREKSSRYEQALHDIWSIMHKLQLTKRVQFKTLAIGTQFSYDGSTYKKTSAIEAKGVAGKLSTAISYAFKYDQLVQPK